METTQLKDINLSAEMMDASQISSFTEDTYPNATKDYFCAGKDIDVSNKSEKNRNIAIGLSATVVDDYTNPTNRQGIAIGREAKANHSGVSLGSQSGSDAIAKYGAQTICIGYKAGAKSSYTGTVTPTSYGVGLQKNILIGERTSLSDSINSVVIGTNAQAISSSYSVAIGHSNAQTDSEKYAVVQGGGAVAILGRALKNDAIAIGTATRATGSRSIQLGSGTQYTYTINNVPNTLKVGDIQLLDMGKCRLMGNLSNVAICEDASSSAWGIAIGLSSQSGQSGIAIGEKAILNATNMPAIAIGKNATCKNAGGLAIGQNAEVVSNCSDYRSQIAIGYNAKVVGPNSACQIGEGTNDISNSLKFRDTTIVNTNGTLNALSLDFDGFINFLNAIPADKKTSLKNALTSILN